MIPCMEINIKLFYKVIPLFFDTRHAQSTQNNKLQYLCKISKKKGGLNLILCMQINIRFSCKLRQSVLLGMASLVQNTQSTKFAKSLQYVKKARDEVDFLCR